MPKPFANRQDAGRQLADLLGSYEGQPGVLVLALPRGGVPVAAEIATALYAPLDVYLTRRLALPGFEELTIGTLASGGLVLLNRDLINSMGVPNAVIEQVIAVASRELAHWENAYRGARPVPDV